LSDHAIDSSIVVARASGEWETLTSADLEDEIWATPVIADGKLHVRTRHRMFSSGGAR